MSINLSKLKELNGLSVLGARAKFLVGLGIIVIGLGLTVIIVAMLRFIVRMF